MNAPPGATIYALSSGSPPAAIAVVRISGPQAEPALEALAGRLPPPRHASLAVIRHPDTREVIDNAVIIRFPGPASATGEDVVELHLHGGRSVVAAVSEALEGLAGLRAAEPGEFTRRAFEHGRIDLTEAEGLADLLSAETQSQRRAAIALAGGALARRIHDWQSRLLALSASVEAELDFSDEGDVGPPEWRPDLQGLIAEMAAALARPPAERLRDGIRVVIAGPPNAGKSTLLNALVEREAAITSPIAGTTRDVVEAPVAIHGVPFVLADTAGLREGGGDIETIGIERARARLAEADLILWLGDPGEAPDPPRTIILQSKADLASEAAPEADLRVSPVSGEGMDTLVALLVERARRLLPGDGEAALNARHRSLLAGCLDHLREAADAMDSLLAAESLRQALAELDRITGKAGVEAMLDALFGAFCIGK